MKKNKLFTILLALVVGISLCACSNTSDASEIEETGPSLEEQVIGIWKSNRYKDAGLDMKTYNIIHCLEIYKGGTAEIIYQVPRNSYEMAFKSSGGLTWEVVEDDIINIGAIASSGYIYDEESDTLTTVDGEYTYTRIDETDEEYAELKEIQRNWG